MAKAGTTRLEIDKAVVWIIDLGLSDITVTRVGNGYVGRHTVTMPPGRPIVADIPASSARAIHEALEDQHQDELADEHYHRGLTKTE